jgi:hypothetical protein
MRFGTREMVAHSRTPLRLGLVALVAALISTAGPASGQDKPTLKDVLGRVQSESETKAVEDLVDKLKGTARKPDKGAPAPAATPGAHRCPRAAHGAAGSPLPRRRPPPRRRRWPLRRRPRHPKPSPS